MCDLLIIPYSFALTNPTDPINATFVAYHISNISNTELVFNPGYASGRFMVYITYSSSQLALGNSISWSLECKEGSFKGSTWMNNDNADDAECGIRTSLTKN